MTSVWKVSSTWSILNCKKIWFKTRPSQTSPLAPSSRHSQSHTQPSRLSFHSWGSRTGSKAVRQKVTGLLCWVVLSRLIWRKPIHTFRNSLNVCLHQHPCQCSRSRTLLGPRVPTRPNFKRKFSPLTSTQMRRSTKMADFKLRRLKSQCH